MSPALQHNPPKNPDRSPAAAISGSGPLDTESWWDGSVGRPSLAVISTQWACSMGWFSTTSQWDGRPWPSFQLSGPAQWDGSVPRRSGGGRPAQWTASGRHFNSAGLHTAMPFPGSSGRPSLAVIPAHDSAPSPPSHPHFSSKPGTRWLALDPTRTWPVNSARSGDESRFQPDRAATTELTLVRIQARIGAHPGFVSAEISTARTATSS